MDTAQHNLCSAVLNALACLPCLPKVPLGIDFTQAASSKDKAHTRAKSDQDKLKLSLPLLSPGQQVFLQDSKSSAWDKQGIVVSVRPDRLSYIVNVDVHFDVPIS